MSAAPPATSHEEERRPLGSAADSIGNNLEMRPMLLAFEAHRLCELPFWKDSHGAG